MNDHLKAIEELRVMQNQPMGISAVTQLPSAARNQTVYIQYVENGFIITIGCKTFVAQDWITVADGLGEYWKDPYGAEMKFSRK